MNHEEALNTLFPSGKPTGKPSPKKSFKTFLVCSALLAWVLPGLYHDGEALVRYYVGEKWLQTNDTDRVNSALDTISMQMNSLKQDVVSNMASSPIPQEFIGPPVPDYPTN